MSTVKWTHSGPHPPAERGLDVERDSDVPISTQIYWQLAYQIDSGRLQPGVRLAPVRELGAALRVNPNTIRAVYRRLADNGYVMSRHGAGTVVADRNVRAAPARGARRASCPRCSGGPPRPGSRPTRSPRPTTPRRPSASAPGDQVRVLFAECTTADAGYDAERLNREFAGSIEAEGTLLDELPGAPRAIPLRPRRDDDLPRRRGAGPRRRPGAGRRDARRAGLRRARPRDRGPEPAGRGSASCAPPTAAPRTSARPSRSPGTAGRRAPVGDHPRRRERLALIDRTADLILMSREALPRDSTSGSSGPSGSGRGRTSSTRPASRSCDARSSTWRSAARERAGEPARSEPARV